MAATWAALGLVPLVVVLVGVLVGVDEAPLEVAVLGAGVGVPVVVVVEVDVLEFATGVLVALEVLELGVDVAVLPPVLALVARAVVLAVEADFPLVRVSWALQAASGMASARTMTSIGAALSRVLARGQTRVRIFLSCVIISGSLVEHLRCRLMLDCNFPAA